MSTTQTQIVYSDDFLKANSIIVDRPIRSIRALKQFLYNLDYELTEVKDHVYLIRPVENSQQLMQSPIMAIGNVIDTETGYQIVGAKIHFNTGTDVEVVNNKSGYYLTIDDRSKLKVTITAPGYNPQHDEIDFQSQAIVSRNFELQKSPEALENLYVTTSHFDFKSVNQANQSILTRDELTATPHIGNDPARAVNKLPGITSNGITARSHVRGGKQNESQVVLNGLALRNPYHFKDFFGVFSSINLSYVDELSIYAGVFPAKYGSYISSVMEIQSSEPSDDLFVDLSLGILSSHITLGESFNTESQYLVSYRSGGDLLRTELFNIEAGDPSFDDLFIHLQQEFDDGTVIKGNLLHAKDTIKLNLVNEDETARAKYIDNNYWMSIEKPINENLNLKGLVFFQSNNTNRNGDLFDDELQGSIFESRKTNTSGFSAGINYSATKSLAFSLGMMLKSETTDIKYTSDFSGSDFLTEILNPNQINRSRNHRFKNSGIRKSLYGNVRYKFNNSFYGDFGLRLDHQDWNNETQISPRMNLSFFYDDTLTFRLGLGRHFQDQHIDGVLLEDEELMYFEPESADIAIFEVQKELNNHYNLRTEFYYKKYNDVQPYYENLFIDLHLHPELFSDRIRVEPESAFSKGVDVTVSGYYDQFNWSASYSFSEVKDVIGGDEFLRGWDQQNAVKLNLEWFWRKWQFNSLMQYHTGWPRTLINDSEGELIIGNRNGSRNKDFLNLDLRLSYDGMIKGHKAKYWLQLNNALNRKNQCCSEYSYEENDEGDFVLINEQKDWLPLIPSIGFDLSF
ncbi:TonB-dependent receptor plug domain-containing protein [Marinicella litoralis]|uniref:TonB-dependent receptor plug domain-containing protein n=1 Tax=Marinicella litoralis TaxID=644220 RepID=UPI0013C2A99E|nr:TonB-dependent receptor plug domain-containing protein [Marinicella litoralis]